MTATVVVHRLRLFLLGVAAFLCIGTLVELWLTEHTEELMQLLPFGLCTLALAVILTVLVKPQPTTVWALRIVMAVVGLSSLLGVYEHLTSNFEVVLEVNANATFLNQVWEALHGAAPMLAPGILALTAALAVSATYYHPALGDQP